MLSPSCLPVRICGPKRSLTLRQRDTRRQSWCLAGLTTVADWIGLNADWFPATTAGQSLTERPSAARQIAPTALRRPGLTAPAPKPGALFGLTLRPMQNAALKIALPPGPTLAVITNETGAGRTEAAFIPPRTRPRAGKA